MEVLYSIVNWFAMHPVDGVSASVFNDLLVVLLLGAFTGLTRVYYEQDELHKNGGWKRRRTGLMMGMVGAVMGSEIADVLFRDSVYTWILAVVIAWSGAELMNAITKLFGEKIQNASDQHNEHLKVDIDREHEQAVELDVIDHQAQKKELEQALTEPS